jgi:hypothetical protein
MNRPGRIGGEFVMASNPASAAPKLRLWRALVAAIAAEVVLGVLAALAFGNPTPTTGAVNIVVPVAAFVVFIPAGWWTARPALPGTQVINGALPGLWGVVLYIVLTLVAANFVAESDFASTLRPAYLIAHALKIAGGLIGGWLASRKA